MLLPGSFGLNKLNKLMAKVLETYAWRSLEIKPVAM
jgi:hypothetical protein